MDYLTKNLRSLLEFGILTIALLTVLQVLFGSGIVSFFGIDVISNIGKIVGAFGKEGLVGVIAAILAAWLIIRQRPFDDDWFTKNLAIKWARISIKFWFWGIKDIFKLFFLEESIVLLEVIIWKNVWFARGLHQKRECKMQFQGFQMVIIVL